MAKTHLPSCDGFSKLPVDGQKINVYGPMEDGIFQSGRAFQPALASHRTTILGQGKA